MKGVFGRYVEVDLSTGAIEERGIPEQWWELHLGGRGLAARLVWAHTAPGTAPLSPENALVFATGPLQGTGLAGAGRHVVASISPKTRALSDSYAGGFWGHELGRSGYDALVVRGQAARPVYLLVDQGKAELRDASDLWGKFTGDVEQILKARYPGARIAQIGPAGEKLVSQACIMHDVTRAAGRPGLGAVMGAKKLKAVVVRGHTTKDLSDPQGFAEERAIFAQELMADPGTQRFGEYGTARGLTWLSEMGILPTKNFQEGVFDQPAAIGGETLKNTILVDRDTCAGCPVRCKRVVKTEYLGRAVDPVYGGPEYETLAALGSLCLCAELPAIALANQLCNAYGLDTISVGVAIAALMEASEKGLIREQVTWGEGRAVVEWVEKIGRREGLGHDIAGGLEAWARKVGADFAMTIKGVEVPMHEPRGKVGLGLSYALSPRGATHLEGLHDTMLEIDSPTPELGVTHGVDRFQLVGKAKLAVLYEDLRSFVNSLVMCVFVTREVGPRYNIAHLRRLVELATGMALGPEEMLRIGARNYALLKLFAAQAGLSARDDGLHPRLHEPLPRGASAARPIDPTLFNKEVEAYYKERGWSSTGPTPQTLRKLGLEELLAS